MSTIMHKTDSNNIINECMNFTQHDENRKSAKERAAIKVEERERKVRSSTVHTITLYIIFYTFMNVVYNTYKQNYTNHR